VFGTLPSASGPDALAGQDPPQSLADDLVAAWAGFARTGDPGWPEFDVDRRAVRRIDTTSSVEAIAPTSA
jgi:carboxylesterase type B